MTEEEIQRHVKCELVVLNLSDCINRIVCFLNLSDCINRIVCFNKNANSRDKTQISDILSRNN